MLWTRSRMMSGPMVCVKQIEIVIGTPSTGATTKLSGTNASSEIYSYPTKDEWTNLFQVAGGLIRVDSG